MKRTTKQSATSTATRISVRLPKKLRDHYERIARAEERSFSFIIARTLRIQAEAAK